MSNTTTKVLAGCGVGCLLCVVAIVGLGWMGYRWARTAAEVVEAAAQAEAQLVEQYGAIRDFRPPLDVQVRADRLEVFLSVREAMTLEREALAEAVSSMAPVNREGGIGDGLKAVRSAMSMAPRLLEYVSTRNTKLLDAGMGLGEYEWYYWLTYHAWLGHPADESVMHEIMEDRAHGQGSVQVHMDGEFDTEGITRRLRRDLRAMLQHLEGELAADPERADLNEIVTVELAALEDDSDRIPWQDGLPEMVSAGLEPYRERLEATYSPATNMFELLELD